jgi:AraC-like DNA-binding protein
MTYDTAVGQPPGLTTDQTWAYPDGLGGTGSPSPLGSLPAALGTAGYVEHHLRPGMELVAYEARLNAPVTCSVGILAGEPYFWLPITLTGGGTFRHGRKLSGSGTAGTAHLALLEEPWTDLNHRPGETLSTVDLIVTASRLRDILQGQGLPPLIEGFMAGRFDPLVAEIQTTATMRRIADQIRNHPYQGAIASVYLEGKAYEVLAETLSIIADIEKRRDSPVHTRRQVMAARDIMMADLANPPRIEDVARQVGLSQRHLNNLFREQFGVTPLQFVTQWRLEQARILLARGDLSVKQVSHMAGYAHVSSFSYAYSRHFGESPGRS